MAEYAGGNWNPLNWPAAVADSFFQTAGADMSVGISTGLSTFVSDLWKSVAGPVYILIGAWLVLIAFTVLFKDQMLQIGSMALAGRTLTTSVVR